MPEYPDEDVRLFLREHPEAGYWSRLQVEREMDVEVIKLGANLDERFIALALLAQSLLADDDEPPSDLRRSFAAETLRLTYLQGYPSRRARVPPYPCGTSGAQARSYDVFAYETRAGRARRKSMSVIKISTTCAIVGPLRTRCVALLLPTRQ
jgi:hypothetical protein